MPPDNFGKYQSRLFNLFRQKNRSWSEKVRHILITAKVNASQSLELIIYSVILMMRKVVESSGKKLTSKRRSKTSYSTSQSRDPQKYQNLQTKIIHNNPKVRVASIDSVLKYLESHIILSGYQNSRVLFSAFQDYCRAIIYGHDSPKNHLSRGNKRIFQTFTKIIEFYIFRKRNNINQPSIDSNEELPLISTPSQNLSNPNIKNSEIIDPWLTLNDLFGHYQDITLEVKANKGYGENSEDPGIRNHWDYHQTSPQKLVGNTQPLMVTLPTFTLEATNNQLETNPEYIDTQAQFVSYTQHPLEWALQLLDNGMLWLEEKFIRMLKFFRQIWGNLLRKN
mgnify:CR=1 FL=1